VSQQEELIDLQVRLTHQQFALDEMTQIMMQQADAIAHLEKKVARLSDVLQAVAQGIDLRQDEAPPPHY